MAPRGRPYADDEPVLRNVVAAWCKLGGPRHCPFERAVRMVVTNDYARKHHYATEKNLRERIYALKRTPQGTARLDALVLDYAVDRFDELKKRVTADAMAASDKWRSDQRARIEDGVEPWRRLVAFQQAFPALITCATPVAEAWRLYDEADKAVRKSMRTRNPRRRNSSD